MNRMESCTMYICTIVEYVKGEANEIIKSICIHCSVRLLRLNGSNAICINKIHHLICSRSIEQCNGFLGETIANTNDWIEHWTLYMNQLLFLFLFFHDKFWPTQVKATYKNQCIRCCGDKMSVCMQIILRKYSNRYSNVGVELKLLRLAYVIMWTMSRNYSSVEGENADCLIQFCKLATSAAS